MQKMTRPVDQPAHKVKWMSLWLPLILLCMTACSGNKPYTVDLMPAPEVYASSVVDPFSDIEKVSGRAPYQGMLYATDRQPSDKNDRFYENKRGFVLRLGLAGIALGKEDLDWEEARRVSFLKNRSKAYPLKVAAVEEFGILDRSIRELTDPALLPADLQRPAARFAELINQKLQTSRLKEILIYVHGYKVVFDNPVLLTTELWHFLGYEGAAIAFSWPSTPSTWAYFSDLETAALSAHSLRVLIEYLSEETDAERINIIGYSAGTRVVIDALDQLSLIYSGSQQAGSGSKQAGSKSRTAGRQRKFSIGQVILVGSDYDRHLFGAALANGLLEVPDRLTIYLSEADKALGISQWLFKRDRLGQIWKERSLKPHVSEYLRRNPALVLIDVSAAESATRGTGHDYFRSSPWVSSDILISLLYDLGPEKRGLAEFPDLPVWHFPEDYNERLATLLNESLPNR